MVLAVELLKEVAQITCMLSCVCWLDEKGKPRKWRRNEAVLAGLMVRISKLQSAILDQVCQKRMEIVNILLRCTTDSLITLEYLLAESSANLFDEYVEYSLREEKRLLGRISGNINDRGVEWPIETRMKGSIDRAFKKASLSPNDVNEKSRKPWGGGIYQRATKLGFGEAYFALLSLPSHSIHGNWQDLITYHLDYDSDNDVFTPNLEWGQPRPQPLFGISLLSARLGKQYLDRIVPPCPEKTEVGGLLNDVISRTRVCDELYEKFLQKNP